MQDISINSVNNSINLSHQSLAKQQEQYHQNNTQPIDNNYDNYAAESDLDNFDLESDSG